MRRAWLLVALLACSANSGTSTPADGGADSTSNGDDAGIDDPRGMYLLRETFNAMPSGMAPSGVWQTSATAGASVSERSRRS